MPEPSRPPEPECRREVTFAPGIRFTMVLDAEFNDPISQLFAAGGFYMPHLCDLLLRLIGPGGRLLDLGAHLGTVALTAAAAGREVLAVEASPRNVELLRRSVAANGFSRLRVVHAAAGSAGGAVEFAAHGPWGHVATPLIDLPRAATRLVAVDELLREVGWPAPGAIKMDIEGSEPAALEGMKELLRRPDAPPLVYECNSAGLRYYGRTETELKGQLERLGYRNYLIEAPGAGDRLLARVARLLGAAAPPAGGGGRLIPVNASDPQPIYNVDYLAVKGSLPDLAPWSVAEPLTRREVIARVLASCEDAEPNQRVHLDRLLVTGPSWLRDDERVRRAVDALLGRGSAA
jgi:FkbM family methyltransferase